MEAEPPSSLRTFLIADVRGYTRYTHEQGDEEAAKVAGRFAQLARRGITEHGGELLELRGDEALGVFGSARDALRAAVELQRLFRTRTDAEPALALGVGIGLDAGEAVPVEDGYRGGALNLAARLCGSAAAGEILASETVVSLAGQIEGIRFEPRGTKRLKGLDEPVQLVGVVPMERLGPVPAVRMASLRRFRRRHLTGRTAVAGALVALTAATVAGVVLVVSAGPGASSAAAAATHVGLVLPRRPTGIDDTFAPYVDGLLKAERLQGLDGETLVVDPSKEKLPDTLRRRLEDFDLVLLGGAAVHDQFADEVALHPDTHFVFLDPSPSFDASALTKLPNYSDVFFVEGPPSFLAGYLAVLMEKRRAKGASVVVSLVAGQPGVSDNVFYGFDAGVHDADPLAEVLLDYSNNSSDPSVCEAIANRQIDRGSTVVYAASGTCSLGALSAASIRGVWGIGADVDRSYLGPHVLISTVKHLDRAVDYAIRAYLDGTLGHGSLDIGINEGAVDIVGISSVVPRDVRKKIARVREQHREEWTPNEAPSSASG